MPTKFWGRDDFEGGREEKREGLKINNHTIFLIILGIIIIIIYLELFYFENSHSDPNYENFLSLVDSSLIDQN